MNECVPISETEPVRQGDVFVSHPRGEGGEGVVRVVLTADCDIAQSKAGPNLLVLPIITAENYILEYWLEEKRRSISEKLAERLAELVNHCHQAQAPGATEFRGDFLVDWALSGSSDEIAAAVGADQLTHACVNAVCNAVRQLNDATPASNVEEAIDGFFELQHKAGLIKEPPKRKTRQSELRNVLKNPRADAFFLTSVPTFSATGWLILLRSTEAIAIEHLHRARLDWFNDPDGYFRLARLAPVYKYALSQQFAMLFSRIGLPSDYDQWKGLVIDELTSLLYPEGASA